MISTHYLTPLILKKKTMKNYSKNTMKTAVQNTKIA